MGGTMNSGMVIASAEIGGNLVSGRLLSLCEVAARLGVSRAWVRDHATRRNPRIPVVRLGGKRAILRFRPQDIENFINAHLQVQQGGV
jgi:predicted DNA-binding transcriptional regulator AlpA